MRALHRDGVFLALAAATLAATLYLVRTQTVPYGTPWMMLDEGYRTYPSLRLLRGESLFGGMFTPYPPFSYQLHRLAFELLGPSLGAIRAVLAICQLAITGLVYAIARRFMTRRWSAFAGVLSVVYGIVQLPLGYSGWYAVPPTLGALLFLLRHLERGDERREAGGPEPLRELLLAGLCAGVAVGFKHRDGAWVAIACGVSVLLLRIARDFEPGRGRPARFHPLYAAHLLLPALVLAVVWPHLDPWRFALFVAPGAALCAGLLARQLFGTARVRARPGRLLVELASFGAGVAAVNLPWIAWYAARQGGGEIWRQLVTIPFGMQASLVEWIVPASAEGVLRFALLPLATGLCLLRAARHWRRSDRRELGLLVLAVFNAIAVLSLYPFTDVNHWLWACGSALILACFFASRVEARLARRLHASGLLVGAAQLALLVALWPTALDPFGAREPRVRIRGSSAADVPMDPQSARLIQPVVDFVNRHTRPDAFVLEIPSPFFVFLTGRRQAASLDYFYALDAGLWNEERELRHLQETAPRYAIVPTGRPGWPTWRTDFPRLSAYLDFAFRRKTRLGRFAILERRGALRRRPDGARGPR